ncbi:MAG: AzlC family ABC transporter permease [Firmicutes bacterium]|nr:AzlC family ABC transporter permease [Bacillota bacterium]
MIKQELQQGLKDSIPVVLGYLPLGFAFGVLAGDSGLSAFQAFIMSALCLTGAGQFIAVGMFKAGAAVIAIFLTIILVNLRYSLFAASTVPHLKGRIPPLLATALSFFLTDEIYAVSMNRYRLHPPTTSYLIALGLPSYLSWSGSTLAGALLGTFVANTDRLGMNFALPAMYISLLVILIQRRSHLYAAIAASVVALLVGHFFPAAMSNNFNIIAATFVGATLGVILDEKR